MPQRVVDIRYRGPAPDWSRLPAADVLAAGPGYARVRVDRETDPAAALAVVGDRTEVLSFAYQPPTLSELVRGAVAA